jgi:hypothetical protein
MEPPIGHHFDGEIVHPVYIDSLGRQHILLEEGEGAVNDPIYGPWLDEGKDWFSPGVIGPLSEYFRRKTERRAFHEAGHAGICFDLGIAVEYIAVPLGDRKGRCQYDYRLNVFLKTDFPYRAEKFVRVMLGGMEAEKLYLERAGIAVEQEHPRAWSDDFELVRECLNDMIERGLTDSSNIDAEILRFQSRVRERLQESSVWGGIEAIAAKLVAESAISGKMARDLFFKENDSPTK